MSVIYLASLYVDQLNIIQKWVHTFYKKWPPKVLLKEKILKKLRFYEYFSKEKREKCDQKHWSVSNTFGINIPCEATYSLEIGFTESSCQSFLVVKILLKLRFLEYFSKAKTEECYQKSSSVSDKFGTNTTCSISYHLEVNAPVSLKAATAKPL